jgi:glycine betaine/choline ABC-type transport system substrate-binding protein
MDRKTFLGGLSLVLAGCSSRKSVVVGSKNFTEQVLLGEILAQLIERQLGVAVFRKLDLGGTLLAHEALTSGSIDLYPEYTGTALTAVLKQPPLSDPKAVLEKVRSVYANRWQLAWVDPLGFNNTFAMIVRADEKARSLSEAATSRTWRLGIGYEFQQRPDGLNGLMKTYNLRLEGNPVTMDLGLLYSALQSRKVDMIAANSTDGLISVLPVRTLEDDRRYFPPYECAVVVRDETLARFSGMRIALESLSGRLNDVAMRKLNYEVDGKHRRVADVAAEFLRKDRSLAVAARNLSSS